MTHVNPQSRLAPKSRLFTAMAWGGLAVAVVSLGGLALFSIYQLLAGVFVSDGVVVASNPWLIGLAAFAAGFASSMVGFTMGRDSEPGRSLDRESTQRRIAA